jgi:hypothetical protein
MKTRLAGLGLIGCGILAAVLFVYLPVRDGPNGFMGPVRLNALVFVPLEVVTGLAFVIGGSLVLVLSIIIGSGALTGLGYWQLKTRWLRPPEPVILDGSPRQPKLPDPR